MKKISLLILIITLTACATPVTDMAESIPTSTVTQNIFPTDTLTPQPTATQTITPYTPTLDPKEQAVIVGFTEEINAAIAEMVQDKVPLIPLRYTDGTDVELGIAFIEGGGESTYVYAKYRGILDLSEFISDRFDPGKVMLYVFESESVNGKPVYFYLAFPWVAAFDSTQRPVVFLQGDIATSGLFDSQYIIERPKWHNLFNYLGLWCINREAGTIRLSVLIG